MKKRFRNRRRKNSVRKIIQLLYLLMKKWELWNLFKVSEKRNYSN